MLVNRLWILVVVSLASCVASDPGTPEEQISSAVTTPATGQGTRYQGTRYQGTRYQGTRYQGTRYQGTRYQGASYAGSSMVDGTVKGTELSAWTQRPDKTWAQRFPNSICYWNANRTTRISCTRVNLATSPSPLAGATWPATFQNPDGSTFVGVIQIGASATALGAITTDTSSAMHSLTGSSSTCSTVTCDNPAGCRINCDLWMYDVRLADASDL